MKRTLRELLSKPGNSADEKPVEAIKITHKICSRCNHFLPIHIFFTPLIYNSVEIGDYCSICELDAMQYRANDLGLSYEFLREFDSRKNELYEMAGLLPWGKTFDDLAL